MRILLLAALALALSACAGKVEAPPPAVEVRTVTVDRVVTVPCVKLAEIPVEPAKVGAKLNGDARHDLDITAASALRLRSWGQKMAAMLIGCAR